MHLNTIKYDSFAGFNPARNYANFAEWFVNFWESLEISTSNLSKNFLTSPEMVFAFNNYITNGTPLTLDEIDQRLNEMSSSDLPKGELLWNTFNNAIKIYKVIKFDKNHKLVKNVDHIWFQNQIFQNLGKKLDKDTLSALSEVYQKELNSYINEYLTSKEYENGSAFDSIFWGVYKNKEKNDLEKLFWVWQRYKSNPKTGTKKSFSQLYAEANPNDNKPEEFEQWTRVIHSLGLCPTFGQTAKKTKLFADKIKYVKNPNNYEGHYELIPPTPPKKFPFTEKEVDYYLKHIWELKKKAKNIKSEKAKSSKLFKITNDPRLDGVNFSTFAEYLTALKIAYKVGITPAELFQANIIDYGRKGEVGPQWIEKRNFGIIRFGTKFDINLNPMYTATGGHGDIELLVARKDGLSVYSAFEPTVHKNWKSALVNEQFGVFHVLDGLKENKLSVGIFNLVSFFDNQQLTKEFSSINTMHKFENHQENVELFTHCHKFDSIPEKFDNLIEDLQNPTSALYRHEYVPEQEKMYQELSEKEQELSEKDREIARLTAQLKSRKKRRR